MSLVPILYTSILLFTIIMIAVLTISYISYKVRRRKELSIEQDRTAHYNLRKRFVEQQPRLRTNTIKVVSTIKNPELKKTVDLPYYSQRSEKETRSSQTQIINRDSSRQKYTIHEPSTTSNEALSYNYRNKTNTQKGRIEIINNNSRYEENTSSRYENPPVERFQVSGSGSIALPKHFANFKAINYYSDNEEENLFKPTKFIE